MGAMVKKVGLLVIVFDLFVGVAAAAVFHPGSGSSSHGTMGASRLEQLVEASATADQASSQWPAAVHTTCSTDPTGGWDYYCISSDGSRAFYDVSADRITQRSDLPSFR
jgi:hypothetical protein